MTPIETLTRLDALRQELHCQREKIACLEEAARYLSPAGDGVGGGPSDRVGRMAGQIADERAELERMEERYSQAVAEAMGILEGLADPLERKVLMIRYIEGTRWEEVAAKSNCSIRTCYRIQQKLFENFLKVGS